MKSMGVTEAKARFLSVVTDVETRHRTVILTRNGRNVAKIVPIEEDKDPLTRYKFGGVSVLGDIESPANEPEDWEYD